MTFLTRHLKQTATHWAISGIDNFGDPSFNTPTTLLVRWEDRTELFVNSDGREERSSAVVFLAQDVAVGSYIFLGTSTAADPTQVTGARLVKDFRKVPGLGGDKFERRVIL